MATPFPFQGNTRLASIDAGSKLYSIPVNAITTIKKGPGRFCRLWLTVTEAAPDYNFYDSASGISGPILYNFNVTGVLIYPVIVSMPFSKGLTVDSTGSTVAEVTITFD